MSRRCHEVLEAYVIIVHADARKLLTPFIGLADGISIPASYSAYLAPLSSSKLYNEVRVGKDSKSSETPYVVMFQAVNILSGDGGGAEGRCGPKVQECWDFEHPRRDAVLNELGKYCDSHWAA